MSSGVPAGYEVKRRVAEGGMGVVYEAVQTALGRRVALKVLHPHIAALPEALERFRREAQLLARLEHPHAVRVYDFIPTPPPTLVMEFIDGESAEARLEREGRLPLELVAKVADQVLSVLEVVHGLGIVHRDLKPANVMFDAAKPPPFVRVVDFGIALLSQQPPESRLTREGHVAGTAAYMSPEQASGEPLDDRSDQYAFACVLFELLTGRAPFESSNAMHVLSAHLFREPPTLEECGVTTVPPGFQRALRRALEKSPGARFPDTRTFREALAAGLVAERAESERQVAPAAPAFVAAEVDDPPVALDFEGAPLEARELALTALAAVGVATVAGQDAPVVVAWPARGVDALALVDSLVARGRRVLLCGPEDDLTLMTRAIEHGVHDYVALPLEGSDFARRVVRALRAKRKP
ncbi:MAG: serine/threonine-protein kinase [Myxococcota bacterium]